ncbi:unnamed protein product, partial [Ectocarpus sp. 4 AP-2014]
RHSLVAAFSSASCPNHPSRASGMLLVNAVESRHRLGQRVSAAFCVVQQVHQVHQSRKETTPPPGAIRLVFFLRERSPLSLPSSYPREAFSKDVSVFMYDCPWCTSFTYFLLRAYSLSLFGPI